MNNFKKRAINSLLDTDLYKFTMMQVVMHQFPNARDVEYRFKCRNKGIPLAKFIDEINDEIDHLCSLTFKPEELDFLRGLDFITDDFVDFLEIFKLQRKFIKVEKLNDEEIDIVIKGPWLHTILFEVPVLSIVNEVYFKNSVPDLENSLQIGRKKLMDKVKLLKDVPSDFMFSDFGTRRRFSFDWQEEVVQYLIENAQPHFTGTSNVYFAMKYGLTPIGTMAHEYLQACQVLGPNLEDFQKFALNTWANEYRGRLGIALTDVIGIDAFLNDFDLFFCKLFDGVRHDSGDPFEWAKKVIEHYKKMKVNPKDKSLVFSDGLNFEKALEIYKEFKDQAKLFFGIGTNLTNDLDLKAINIVIKMITCNNQSVAKLSDEPGKTMCKDLEFLAQLKRTFDKILERALEEQNRKKLKNKMK